MSLPDWADGIYSALDAKLGALNGLSSYVTAQVAQWNKA